MRRSSFALDDLPWTEVRGHLERDPRLILPVGALEQHGPHLPLGTNALIAERVAAAVSDRLRILRAPVFSYGVTVGGGPFPGRAGITRKTLHRVVNELFGMWDEDGIVHYLVITAHRAEPHLEALLMTNPETSHKSVYDLYQIDVSDIVQGDPEFEQGGELETSLMLHLAPDLVRMDHAVDFLPEGGGLRKYTRRRAPTPPKSSLGVLGAPSQATDAKGAAIFDRYVTMLAHAIQVGSEG